MCVVVVAWYVDEITSMAAPGSIFPSRIRNSILNGVGLSASTSLSSVCAIDTDRPSFTAPRPRGAWRA